MTSSIKSLLAIAVTVLFSITNIEAAVNVETYMKGNGIIPSNQAKELLNGVLLHNPSLLDNTKVEVANLRKRQDVNIAFIYVGRQEAMSTEIYAVTLDPQWNVIDGALLGTDGDARLLAIPSQNQEYIYKPNMDIEYMLRGDSIIVTRTYVFASTALGGNYFRKNGTIYNRFLIRKDGKLVQSQYDAIADLTEGDANYLSENHRPETTSKAVGEFFGLGMQILNMEQTPSSIPLNAKAINDFAAEMRNVAKQNGRKTGNVENECVSEFARGVTNISLRDGKEILSWIPRNEKNESISPFIHTTLRESGMMETEWFIEKIKTLKDKKARKWWQKWLKENMGVETK